MNLAETLQSLLRRWYVVAAGLIVAVLVALAAWTNISPTYVRSATELLLPGAGYVPTGDNPYLYLGGLGQAADVIVSGLSSDNVANEYAQRYPGVTIGVARDPQNSGPAIVISASATDDTYTGPALNAMVTQLSQILEDIQAKESVPTKNRISVMSITEDTQSTLQNKTRKMAAGASAVATVVLSIIVAAFIDGMSRRRRRRAGGASSRGGRGRDPQRPDAREEFGLAAFLPASNPTRKEQGSLRTAPAPADHFATTVASEPRPHSDVVSSRHR